MTRSPDTHTIALLTEPATVKGTRARTSIGAETSHQTDPPCGGFVYQQAARILLPRCLRMLGHAPWLRKRAGGRAQTGALAALHRQQSAAQAVGLLCEFDPRCRRDGYLRECVRTALIRWQLALRMDGRPRHRSTWGSPLHHVILACQTQLLSEVASFQSDALLDDLEHHLRWLSGRRSRLPWVEATAISTLADGAVLVRDGSLLPVARDRLGLLLAAQDTEGWFPEHGGFDAGRLSLTIDALARLSQYAGWPELDQPIAQALRMLIHAVHPNGRVGGCYSTCDSAFLSPYGVELLANRFPEAANLAALARKKCQDTVTFGGGAWNDDLVALLAPRIALAGAHAAACVPAEGSFPCDRVQRVCFPHADLTVASTPAYFAVACGRKAGAVHVTWRSSHATLDDPGITAVFRHRCAASGRFDPRSRSRRRDQTLICTGMLRRRVDGERKTWQRWRSWFRRILFAWRRGSPCGPRGGRSGPLDHRRLPHDGCQRAITFADDSIRIQDVVSCRLPCQTVVCQSPRPDQANLLIDAPPEERACAEPICVDGGRWVEVTRVYRNGELVDPALERAD